MTTLGQISTIADYLVKDVKNESCLNTVREDMRVVIFGELLFLGSKIFHGYAMGYNHG